MLESLLTEQINPASRGIDAKSTEDILTIMNQEDQKVALAVASEVPRIAKAVDAIAGVLERGGRLFYIGAGTSGRLGVLDASECPPTFNVPVDTVQGIMAGGDAALSRPTEASEDDAAMGERDLMNRGFTEADVLCGIAASGRTPYVLGAIAAARGLGAITIGVSCTPNSELAQAVDIAITPLPGPEILTGSTRLRAGTATKLVLNMLTTGAMIRLGYVYDNLMVNVQPGNAKLADRARRIVATAAGIEAEEAARMLDASGGVVKTAIVMARRGVGRPEAEDLIRRANGRISAALGL